jgi:hypothetical protein
MTIERRFESTADAGKFIVKVLKARGHEVELIIPINKGRHLLVKAFSPLRELEVYYILYKSSFFFSYSRQFEDADGEGFGESVNLEFMNAIMRSETLTSILVAYRDGYIFHIEPETLKEYLSGRERVRIQHKGEVTCSFPISLLSRWDRNWTSYELDRWIGKPTLSEKVKHMFQRVKEKLFGKPETDLIKLVSDTVKTSRI